MANLLNEIINGKLCFLVGCMSGLHRVLNTTSVLVKNTFKHLGESFLRKYSRPLPIFTKSFIFSDWKGC